MANKEDFGFKIIISMPELLSAIGLLQRNAADEELPDESTEDSEAE